MTATSTANFRLIVQRLPVPAADRFMLTVLDNDKIVEVITAADAQMIIDYVRCEWPAGTRVQWVIA